MIQSHHDRENDLALIECHGRITAEEIAQGLREFYAGEPTRYAIWDFTGADTTQLTATAVRDLSHLVKSIAHSRAGGRTAIVGPENLTFGLARMFEAFADLDEHEFQVRVFRTRAEAEAWIGE